MLSGLWRRIREHRSGGVAGVFVRALDRLIQFLALPAPEEGQLVRRITIMERNLILPVKVAAVGMLLYSFYAKRWFNNVLSALDISVLTTQYCLWGYIAINLVFASLLIMIQRLPVAFIRGMVFGSGLVDGIFLGTLTVLTGGYNSILYWLFLALIVRSAVSVPRATSQLLLNLTLSACYVVAGIIDTEVAANLELAGTLYKGIRQSSGLSEPPDNPAEPLFLRLVVLLLMTVCSYGVQVLLERQRQVEEEAREFAVREGQLRSAGRMAAEVAHQIKNPLAIISTALYGLQRSIKGNRPDAEAQIRIIEEEVQRSDRIITQIMDYAQLAEGRVEKLDVLEELEDALERVFPSSVQYAVTIHRRYGTEFPPLLMQRRHLAEIFINLLQNARDALAGHGGNLHIDAHCQRDYAIEISIRDDGPGIPADKHERIFEAYYTTKEKGTGLGLAIVKQNVGLYGGQIQLESELGKGTRFVLVFPARSLRRLKT